MQVVVIWQLLLLFMMHNIGINFGNSGYNVDSLRIISYNCRGFNDSKQRYMQSLLSRCELLFVQEHWLSDGQLCKLNTLSPVHHSYGICGFSSNEVLRGRPYGGCAILWRQGLCRDVVFVDTGSKRLCAVRCTFDFGVVLFLNVYMPCVGDEASVLEFVNELSIIEGLLSGFNGDHVVVGGDFNVDFNRAWRNTNALRAFCDRTLLQPTVDHCKNMCDYSYSFNMQRFQLLDHFLVSQQLFQDSITDILVLHDTDNLSDHEPVCMYFSIALQCYGVQSRSFVPKVAWQKARPDQVDAYAVALRDALSKLAIPHAAFVCRDVHCRDSSHCICLNKYIEDLTEACLAAAKHTLPHTSLRSGSGRIPGWSEHVEPVRQKSIFWHDMWVNCGRPRSGVVADIMRRTRASYHYAIRMVRRREKEIVNERFTEAVSSSNGRDFWNEVKRIRHSGSGCSNSVDGLTSANEIASFLQINIRICILVFRIMLLICLQLARRLTVLFLLLNVQCLLVSPRCTMLSTNLSLANQMGSLGSVPTFSCMRAMNYLFTFLYYLPVFLCMAMFLKLCRLAQLSPFRRARMSISLSLSIIVALL